MSEPWTRGPWRYALDAADINNWAIIGSAIEIPADEKGGPRDPRMFMLLAPTVADDAEANARLIALAPEMAELLAEYDVATGYVGVEDWERRRKDLLCRARGQSEGE